MWIKKWEQTWLALWVLALAAVAGATGQGLDEALIPAPRSGTLACPLNATELYVLHCNLAESARTSWDLPRGCDLPICVTALPPRHAVTATCLQNSGDYCRDDGDCMVGGCSGEVCFNPGAEASGFTSCTCENPRRAAGLQELSCGCVESRCAWWQ